jgi:hypothetical protein
MRQKARNSLIGFILTLLFLWAVSAIFADEKTLSEHMQSIVVALAAQPFWIQIIFVGEILDKTLSFVINFVSIATILFATDISKKERIEVAFVSFCRLFLLVAVVIFVRLKLSAVLIAYLSFFPTLCTVLVLLFVIISGMTVIGTIIESFRGLRSPLKITRLFFQGVFDWIQMILFSCRMFISLGRFNLDMLLSIKALAAYCVSCGKSIIEGYRYERSFCLAILRDILNLLGRRL